MLRRRELICLIGSAVPAQLFVQHSFAQQPTAQLVGYLSSKGEAAEVGIIAAIRKGLAERGFSDDRSVTFTYRWSEGDYTRLPALAADLVKKRSM